MLKIGKKINKIKEEKLKKIKNKKGFTLIELVIVIVIIGILVGLAVSDLSRDTEDAKIARAKADLKTLMTCFQFQVHIYNYLIYYYTVSITNHLLQIFCLSLMM